MTPSEAALEATGGAQPQDMVKAIDRLAEIQSQEIALRTEQGREERALQSQELALRNEQLQIERDKLDLEKARDQRGYEFGLKSLEAQAADRMHSRNCERGKRTDSHKLVCGLVLIICAVVVYALSLGKDAIAMELVKSVLMIVAGGAAGYGLGVRKSSRDDEASND